VLAVSWLLMSRAQLWKSFIIVASYVFYAAANPRFCLVFITTVLRGEHRRGTRLDRARGAAAAAHTRAAGRRELLHLPGDPVRRSTSRSI
jgi:hypothetical protein